MQTQAHTNSDRRPIVARCRCQSWQHRGLTAKVWTGEMSHLAAFSACRRRTIRGSWLYAVSTKAFSRLTSSFFAFSRSFALKRSM